MSNDTRDAVMNEESPLLPSLTKAITTESKQGWDQPPGFLFIEIAIFTNVFLAGFDGTVTSSTYALISSELRSSNLASWITTSYLLTSTAVQPLYGRFSDIFGRRACFLSATALFGIGCLGCSCSHNMILLIIMRAVCGLGGGGLMTMTTIINTDIIPGRQRGMYQALQNILHGAGAMLGATVGGALSEAMGWRTCFIAQVPIAVTALLLARIFVRNKESDLANSRMPSLPLIERLDVLGATLLFTGLVLQLTGMSLGSELFWLHPLVLTTLLASVVVLSAFIIHERSSKLTPILPLKLLAGKERVNLLLSNICLGITAYGMLFLMPLYFQTVLLDSPSVAGLRLVPPSLATPLGGLTTGIFMQHGTRLTILTRTGLTLVFIGGLMNISLGMHEPDWKYSVFLAIGNSGQGIVYPSLLFGFIQASSHEDHAVSTSLVYLTRSLGTVWGVAAVSTLVQSSLLRRLRAALLELPGGEEATLKLMHSTMALKDLDPVLKSAAQEVYFQVCHVGLGFLVAVTGLALLCSFLIPLRPKHPK